MILKWVNMADLYRVKGVGSEYSELLEKAGVDTVKELRNRNAQNLHAKMEEVNSQGRGLVRQLPALKMVEKWVEEAQRLEPMVTY
jgi:predicted flap endonuclease-1-like 5' DNA nuclease